MPKPQDIPHLAGRFAQLLSETVLQAHPHVAEFNEQIKEHYRANFLDGLEEHTAKLVAPLLKSLRADTTIPPELKDLLDEIGEPTEQFTGIISQFFIFGVMFTLAQAMLAPFVQQVQNDVWSAHPDRPLSPPDLATGAIRGITPGDPAITSYNSLINTIAAQSGLTPEYMQFLVDISGQPPSPQELFEMFRRGIITEDQVATGLKEGDTRDEWVPMFQKLAHSWLTPLDFVRAAVQSQMTYDDAKEWATNTGLDTTTAVPVVTGDTSITPDMFGLAYAIAGRPPGPEEMIHLALRGYIPWTGTGADEISVEQGIHESDIKDKWFPAYQDLQHYWPPNGEVRTLLMRGGISAEQAQAYWAANGVPPALAQSYLYISQVEQLTQDRALAKSDILTLVQEQAVTDAEATEMLAEIGYSGTNAEWLLSMAHFRFELEAIRTAVRNVSTLYIDKTITATQAQSGLQGLGMPKSQVDSLLTTLTFQRNAQAIAPTAAQIASGLFYSVIDQPTATALLTEQGYTDWGAWFVLSVRMHAPLPGEPAQVVAS